VFERNKKLSRLSSFRAKRYRSFLRDFIEKWQLYWTQLTLGLFS